jgi:hypothetical protein
LDALELPRDAGADRGALGCGIGYAESTWPKRIVFGHIGETQRNARQTGI